MNTGMTKVVNRGGFVIRKCFASSVFADSCSYQRILKLSRAFVTKVSNDEPDKVGPERTLLYDFHLAHKGKMVNFAGFLMPLQYNHTSISASHKHTRKHCSLFDVSHMVQLRVTGKDAVTFMESLTVGDIGDLAPHTGTLSLYTNDAGGIIDDLICNKIENEELYVVSNAGRREADRELLKNQLERFHFQNLDVHVDILDGKFALVALQGPEAQQVLQPLTDIELHSLKFMKNQMGQVAGVSGCRVTRCGYTGEDGVEISVPAEGSRHLVEALLASKDGSVKPAGLGARDSLRIEAGLCLYGSDISETTTPVEASLAWTIGKRRRQQGNFPGAEFILAQLAAKKGKSEGDDGKPAAVIRRRIGLSASPGARSFRFGAEVVLPGKDKHNFQVVGHVTSGCPSPTLGYPVGMAYVEPEFAKVGNKLLVRVGKDTVPVKVTKMPFVPTKYYH